MTNFNICGIGTYIPEYVLTNEELSGMVDTNDEWITKRVGIKERHISQGETVWQMGKCAALQALKDANRNPEDIDMIIATTATPDFFYPSLSCLIQKEIKAVNAFCFDLTAGCSGFIYAADVAEKYLRTGEYSNILIVCSECLSAVTDYTDRSTCVLFGDGAGACIVTAQGEGKMLASYLASEGEGGFSLYAKAITNHSPFVKPEIAEQYDAFPECRDHFLKMDGAEVYKFATRAMVHACQKVCEKAGITIDEVDYIIPHQANERIIDFAVKRLKVNPEKAIKTIQQYGNTSSASNLLCFESLIKQGKPQKGDKVIFTAFGAGLTYGAFLLEW